MLVDLGSRVKSFFSLFCNTRSLSWALNSVLGAKGCIGENTNTFAFYGWLKLHKLGGIPGIQQRVGYKVFVEGKNQVFGLANFFFEVAVGDNQLTCIAVARNNKTAR